LQAVTVSGYGDGDIAVVLLGIVIDKSGFEDQLANLGGNAVVFEGLGQLGWSHGSAVNKT
jgi:hypothetical protein